MKKLSDERLEEMLTSYCKDAPEQTFVYDPERKKEKIVPFVRYRRAAAAAASLVLVSVLSLTVYFLFGNKPNTPIAAAPSSQSDITPSAPTGESGGDPIGEDAPTQPTEAHSGLQKLMDALFPKPSQESNGSDRSASSPNNKNTDEKNNKPTTTPSGGVKKPNPTENTNGTPTLDPTTPYFVTPTQTHIDPQPTEPPADPPWSDDPAQPPVDDPWDPETPTEGGGDVELPWDDEPIYINVYIDTDIVRDYSYVYCKVYDNNGTRLGSADLYDDSHIAVLFERWKAKTRINYEVPEGLITQSGYYNFVFYDNNGKVLTQTQEYIDLN